MRPFLCPLSRPGISLQGVNLFQDGTRNSCCQSSSEKTNFSNLNKSGLGNIVNGMFPNLHLSKPTTQLLIAFCLLLSGTSLADSLKPFSSDGCSAFPDGTVKQNELWLSCCQKHDFDYWKGGSYQERLASDNALEACVAGVGEPEIALLMLAGVRVGGSPFWPTRFRWGYGWPYPKLYGPLTASELEQVEKLTDKDK